MLDLISSRLSNFRIERLLAIVSNLEERCIKWDMIRSSKEDKECSSMNKAGVVTHTILWFQECAEYGPSTITTYSDHFANSWFDITLHLYILLLHKHRYNSTKLQWTTFKLIVRQLHVILLIAVYIDEESVKMKKQRNLYHLIFTESEMLYIWEIVLIMYPICAYY